MKYFFTTKLTLSQTLFDTYIFFPYKAEAVVDFHVCDDMNNRNDSYIIRINSSETSCHRRGFLSETSIKVIRNTTLREYENIK